MQEIVTISASHRANHLSTQFFNCQEKNLYNTNRDDSLNTSTFLYPSIDRMSKTASYYPRALIWEARNGSGSLGTYQYVPETKDYHFTNTSDRESYGHKLITTHTEIPRSDYQLALDGNETLPALTKDNTKYWSDYNKLIFQPNAFNSFDDWYHDPNQPNLPDYQNLQNKRFIDINQGISEWELQSVHFMDGNLRIVLEECDNLEGFNIVTDVDSGWGSFTAAMLQELKDELPKSTIFTWGFHEGDILTNVKNMDNKYTIRNKIKNTIALARESDLVFPIFADSLNLSNWEIAGQTCKLYDAVASVISQNDSGNRKSMDYVVDCLTDGDSKRNIISSMVDMDDKHDFSYYSRVQPYKPKRGPQAIREYHDFSYCLINRGPQKTETNEENTEEKSNKKKTKYRELQTTKYSPSDTIPEKYAKSKCYSIKLSTNEKSRDTFKYWDDNLNRYFRYDDEREELKDEINTLISTYEHGWYSDEDSGYDDI